MTIVDKIIKSIQDALYEAPEPEQETRGDVPAPFPVYYHDEPTLNVMTSSMEFPCALFQLLTTGRAVFEGGQAKERVTAAVFFVEPSEFDFDAVENEKIIDRCKQRAFRWLLSLAGSSGLKLEAVGSTARVYDRYDDILTGFGVNVEIKESVGLCV